MKTIKTNGGKQLCKIILIIFVLSLAIIYDFQKVQASTIYADLGNIEKVYIGDTIILNIDLNTDGEKINTVEGYLSFKGENNFLIKEFSLGGSAFDLWPEKPALVEKENKVSFTAGSSKEVAGDGVKILKIILQAKNAGTIDFDTSHLNAYLADGKGSLAKNKGGELKFEVYAGDINHVGINAWSGVLLSDKQPPENLSAIIARDANLFNGQYYVTFMAQDNDSGLAYFTVKENNYDVVRAGSPYLLQNQKSNSEIKITAYDKAGNEISIYLNKVSNNWLKLLGVIVMSLITYILLSIARELISVRIK